MTWTIQQMSGASILSKPLRPLTFDRANRGRPCSSPFPLFRLPVEVLHDVAPHIPSSDLGTLALVDRDCRQLARSVQFYNVKLSYSDVSLGLLETLLLEIYDAQDAFTQTLGPCIRHLTIELGAPMLNETRLARFPALAGFFKRTAGTGDAQHAYLHALAVVLRKSLPNLQSIDWQSRVKMPRELMQSLTWSNARHVTLSRALLDSQMDVFDFGGQNSWSIETLALDVQWNPPEHEDGNPDSVAAAMTSMLCAVAPTLQNFSWRGARMWRLPSYLLASVDGIVFPRLRTLRLEAVTMEDFSLLSSFLPLNSRVTSLAVSSSDPVTVEFLGHRGHLDCLESFSWIGHPHPVEEGEGEVLTFVESNPQIHTLSINQPLPLMTIESQILPAVQNSFHKLTSLHLVWDSIYIPETSLAIIASLHQLRRLWLSAGIQYGWCNNWKIEHDVMLEILHPLHQLEYLAFSRDSYQVNGHPLLDSSVERYYVHSVFPRDKDFQEYLMPDERSLLNKILDLAQYADMSFDQARALQIRLMKAAWERWHQEQMLTVAKAYAVAFPYLVSCYMGQYPMAIERDEGQLTVFIETAFREENIKPL